MEVPSLTEEEVRPHDKTEQEAIYNAKNFTHVEDEEVDNEDAAVEEKSTQRCCPRRSSTCTPSSAPST